MAESAGRKEQLKKVYDRSSKRDDEDGDEGEKKQSQTKVPETKTETRAEDGGGMEARHKVERDEIQRRHEAEARTLHDGFRDESRSMNARHEKDFVEGGKK